MHEDICWCVVKMNFTLIIVDDVEYVPQMTWYVKRIL